MQLAENVLLCGSGWPFLFGNVVAAAETQTGRTGSVGRAREVSGTGGCCAVGAAGGEGLCAQGTR